MSELQPCPFCGGEAEVYLAARYEDKDYYHVKCTNDCVYTKKAKHNENEAIEAWNTRYEPTCHIIAHDGVPACSECLGEMDYHANYCEWCGRKVVSE